jgi:predicted nucleotidyltransferase
MDKKMLMRISKDFTNIKPKTMAILLYGSYVKGEQTPRSDINVCIVAPQGNALKLYMESLALWDYNVRIFETLPLYLKMAVIENHEIIHCGDETALYEYFYAFRREWGDQAHRQQISRKELLRMLS